MIDINNTATNGYILCSECNFNGLENNGDWDGIDAWMPMPEPYKKDGAE